MVLAANLWWSIRSWISSQVATSSGLLAVAPAIIVRFHPLSALEQVPWESLPTYAPPSRTSLAIPTEAHIARTTIDCPGWISFLHYLTYRQFRLRAQIPENNLPIPLSAPFTSQMLRHNFNHLLGAPESAVIHNPFGRHPVVLSSPSRRRCSRRYL